MLTNVVLDTAATSMASPSAARLPPVAKALMSKMAIVTDEVRTIVRAFFNHCSREILVGCKFDFDIYY